jgi:hypothetical protein
MSGGYFDYRQYLLGNIADSIEQVILDYESKKKSEWEDSPKWNFKDPLTILEFRNAVSLIRKASVYAQRIDWLLSDDDGEECFHKRLKEDMKELDKDNPHVSVVLKPTKEQKENFMKVFEENK